MHYFLEDLGLELRSALSQVAASELELLWEQGRKFGDFSTNISFLAAKKLKKNPLEIAELLAKSLSPALLKKVDVKITPPGFLNFVLKEEGMVKILQEVLHMQEKYGCWDLGKGTG